ncbi:MFS general substrate transporter [Annulohypoxylon truncatum]|uniref:MFS general substrate transporter n=1 Tax=Annulohypoxylon truncatum TaxID=327061 RepID=UPI002007F7F3|nr:MFS general substrate transporter [Annulohypoxylon truncatum]KAI1206499.1 MFS general substrate transporter [Annulohypoxylon truncatum]
MWDAVRESSIGQIVRIVFRRPDLLPYPEELDSFELPASLSQSPSIVLDSKLENELKKQEGQSRCVEQSVFSTGTATPSDEKDLEAGVLDGNPTIVIAVPVPAAASTPVEGTPRNIDGPQTQDPAAVVVVVGWYSASDPANPQNWSFAKKVWITTQMGLYTFAVYIGSSLYAPSEAAVMSSFDTSYEAAALGIALYVAGYGLGPLLWAPLSEIPAVGRTTIYATTLFVFACLALGAAVVESFAALLALRFLLGFFGSPCLAAVGATLDDMFAPWKLPYVLTIWSASATLGPALGPVVSGFAVAGMGWRWSAWELAWLAAPVWLLIFLTLPETNPDAILHRRAARLRARAGRSDLTLTCEADLRRAHMLTTRQIVVDALIKPWEINALDPAVLYTTIYSSVLYGTYYSFFEAFPLVFTDMHGFNLGESGLPFLAFMPGLVIAISGYIIWFRLNVEPKMHEEAPPLYGDPESRLFPAVATTMLGPIGLFIFAWTSRPDIHWIVPIIGLMVLFVCFVIAFQCMNFYIARCYPRYSASIFAANTFARSCFAAGSILFSRPMYEKLGVGGGVSLLGGLSVLCAGGMVFLWRYGEKLRLRSRFAQS